MQMWYITNQVEVHAFWIVRKNTLLWECFAGYGHLVSQQMWLLCMWYYCLLKFLFKMRKLSHYRKIIFTTVFMKCKKYFKSCGILFINTEKYCGWICEFFQECGLSDSVVLVFTKWTKTVGSRVKVAFLNLISVLQDVWS